MKKLNPYWFHTALRKSLDSVASSILWNAVYLTTEEQWDRFIREINEKEGSLAERCRDLYLYGENALNLIMIGLKMLEDGEYEVLEKHSMMEEENGQESA